MEEKFSDRGVEIRFDPNSDFCLYPHDVNKHHGDDIDFNNDLELVMDMINKNRKYSSTFKNKKDPFGRNLSDGFILSLFEDVRELLPLSSYSNIFEMIFYTFGVEYERVFNALPDYVQVGIIDELKGVSQEACKNKKSLF